MKKLNLSFFLGSGISIPANIPGTKQLTNSLFDATEKYKHTDDTYLFGKKPYIFDFQDENVPEIKKFLQFIKSEFFPNQDPNYEDLYYVVKQFEDAQLGEYENPLVLYIMKNMNFPLTTGWNIKRLSIESVKYISDIVWHCLRVKEIDTTYLKPLANLLSNEIFNQKYVFTLNHDLLLEAFFKEFQIEFIDFFGKPIYDICYWEPEFISHDSNLIHFAKLHGSINWYLFRTESTPNPDITFGKTDTLDIDHTKDKHGNYQYTATGRPFFLKGVFNKILDYSTGIYQEIIQYFITQLANTDILIISGYSFNDKGINSHILNWIGNGNKKLIILIHPDFEELRSNARPAIQRFFDSNVKEDFFVLIEDKIENLDENAIINKVSEF
jgi:hypothetical protein